MKMLSIIVILLLIPFMYILTIPIWSDSKIVCKYWEKQNNEMVCVEETLYFCLKTNCEN